MPKPSLPQSLIPLILLCAAASAFGTAEPLSCADRSITASAVRTPEDVQAFVQYAYEFVQEVGFDEAQLFQRASSWKAYWTPELSSSRPIRRGKGPPGAR